MADLIAFPLDRHIGKARHVAAMIAKRRGRGRDVYYRVICKNAADRLRRFGFPEHVVTQQIARFTDAVNQCISEGWHFPSPQPDLADAHRILDAGMQEIVGSPDFENNGPGAA